MWKRLFLRIVTWWEDARDRMCYHKAMREWQKNPITYTHEEMKKILGLDNSH